MPLADDAGHALSWRNLGQLVALGLFAFLLMYPNPLQSLTSRYNLYTSYLLWFVLVIFIPLALKLPAYHDQATLLVWTLRWLTVILFLVASFTRGMTAGDLVALVGTLMPTFFFELGHWLAADSARLVSSLKALALMGFLVTAPAGVKAASILIQGGFHGVLHGVYTLRAMNVSWPNYSGILMVICLFIAQYLRRLDGRYGILVAALLCVAVLTLSRAAVIGLLVAGMAGYWLQTAHRPGTEQGRNLLVLPIVGMLGIALAFAVFFFKAGSYGSRLSLSVSERTARWITALDVWADHPVMGLGFRSFAANIEYFSLGRLVIKTGSSHSDYVDLLVRGGLAYFLVWGAYMAYVLRRIIRHSSKEIRGPLLNLSFSIILVVLATAAVQNPLKDSSISGVFWLFIGIAMAISSGPLSRSAGTRSGSWRRNPSDLLEGSIVSTAGR